MINPANVPDVQAEELLARYILFSKHIRSSNETIKPDAFVPHPYHELSVTRHQHASEDEVWAIGMDVAETIQRRLHGRGDITAQACLDQGLEVVAAPLENNPNHANVTRWPSGDKARQRFIAMRIAESATLVRPPAH